MIEPVLSVRNLKVEFATRRHMLRAIDGVCFDIARGEVLGGLPAQSAELAGFFILETKDRARAVEIARQCPHLKHGGQIVVRRIEN